MLVSENSLLSKNSHKSSFNNDNNSVSYPSRTIVHPKLEMTEPGDADEQEADVAANEVMSGKVFRKFSGGGAGGGVAVSSQMESQLNHLQGGGQAMPDGLRGMMERGFDRDFSQVRLHTDGEAAGLSSSIHAKAFTHGNDIYFNQGQYVPETSEGQRLVAHELAHVAQGGGKVGRDPNGNSEDQEISQDEYSAVKSIFKKNEAAFDEIWKHYNTYKQSFDMDDQWNLAHFFAQVYGENTSLSRFEEGFNYSVYRLSEVFSKFQNGQKQPNEEAWRLGYFNDDVCKKYKCNPEDIPEGVKKTGSVSTENQKEIANIVYGGRYGNGSDEGWKYRGRGLIQLTFKDNYNKIQAYIKDTIGKDVDIVNNPDLVSQNMEICVLTAMAFWKKKGLNEKCRNTKKVDEITKIVTGGDRDVPKRQQAFNQIIKKIGL